eukprot:scaffold754_cov248-Pinguiococcus_pyrenoidosus.AAC.37
MSLCMPTLDAAGGALSTCRPRIHSSKDWRADLTVSLLVTAVPDCTDASEPPSEKDGRGAGVFPRSASSPCDFTCHSS